MEKNTKTVFDWILGSSKKRQSSKRGKRPLSSSNIPAPKYPRRKHVNRTPMSRIIKVTEFSKKVFFIEVWQLLRIDFTPK